MPKTAIFSNFGTARLLCFSSRLLFLICFSFFCFFLISFFIFRRPPPVINKPPPLSHRFLTFSHPSFSFPLPASDFFSFLEKTPTYEAVYDIFSKMYVFNFVVSFYADAILYPGVFVWQVYHKPISALTLISIPQIPQSLFFIITS